MFLLLQSTVGVYVKKNRNWTSSCKVWLIQSAHTHTHHTMVIGQHTPHCSMWGNVERVLPSTSIKLWTTFAFHRSHISCEAVSIFHFGPNPAKDLCGSCTRRDLVLMWFRVGCSASKQIITMRAAAAINSLAIDFSDSALSSELRSTYFKYKRI